jgi:polysaccharide biosynthesis protein PslG
MIMTSRFPLRRAALAAVTLTAAALAQPTAADTHPLPTTTGELRVGVQVDVGGFTADDATRIRETGFEFVRLGVWTDSLGSKAYQQKLEAAFAQAKAASLGVLMTVRSLNPFGTLPVDPSLRAAVLTSAGTTFGRAVATLVQEHASQLLAVEIWNEPDLAKYWPPGDVETTLPPYMQAACAQWTTLSRQVPVLGLGFARAPSKGSLPDALLAQVVQRAPGCLGGVSYHAYGMTGPQIAAVSADLHERYRLPAVITEWGVPSIPATGGDAGQAAQVASFLSSVRGTGAPLVSIYEWKDSPNGIDLAQRNYGLVTVGGMAKAALGAAGAELPRVEDPVDPPPQSSGGPAPSQH